MYVGLHVKYRLLLSDVNVTSVFSTYFQKLFKYEISRKSVQWEPSCSMRAVGDTNMTELTAVYRKLVNSSKKKIGP